MTRVTDEEREAIRRLYPTRTAKEVAAELYGDPGRFGRVKWLVGCLGLNTKGRGPRGLRFPSKGKRARNVASQLASVGAASLAELRYRAHRAYAASYGLPPDLRPPQVRMILALLDGPMSLPDIKATIGAAPGCNFVVSGTGVSYQTDLASRGLVVRLPGRHPRYMLTSAALDMLASRKDAS